MAAARRRAETSAMGSCQIEAGTNCGSPGVLSYIAFQN